VDTAVAADHLRFLRREKVHAAAMLNQAKSNTRSFQPTRLQLAEAGPLCPFEVRDLEDIRDTATLGLGVLEISRYQGTEDYRGVWLYTRNELGLG
jgi:chromosome partitioning protein